MSTLLHRIHFPQILRATTVRYTLVQVISAAISFLSLPILTRQYEAAIYGQYLLIISTVALLNGLLTQWLQQTILRVMPGHTESYTLRAAVTSLTFYVAGALALLTPVMLLVLPGIQPSISTIVLTTIYAVTSAFSIVHASFRQAEEQTGVFAAYMFVQNAAPVLIAVSLASSIPFLETLLWSQVISSIITCTIVFRFIWPRVPEAALIKQFLVYGLPLTIWILGAQLLNSLDRFMLAYYFNAQEAGVYTIAYNIVISIQSFAFGPLLLAVHPKLMRLWNSNNQDYGNMLRQAVTVFLILSAIIVGFLAAASNSIGELLLGSAFRGATALMPIISLGHICWSFTAYLNKGFEFRKQTWKMGLLGIVAALINFFLNIVAIPRFGVSAAAYTTLIAYASHLLITYYFSRPTLLSLPSSKMLLLLGATPLTIWMAGNVFEYFELAPALHLVLCSIVTVLALIALLIINREANIWQILLDKDKEV